MKTTTAASGTLRLCFAALLLVVAGGYGFLHRHPLTILLLALAFTALYIGGKWNVWRALWRAEGAGGWARALVPTFAIQAVLAALVYLVGLGLGRLLTERSFADTVTGGDVAVVAGLAALGIGVSAALDRMERGAAASPASDDEERDFIVLPGSVTAETLLSPDANEGATDAQIAAAEARLGFVLPETLRRVYRTGNGGAAPDLKVPAVAHPRPVHGDWRSAFGGYEDLYPLERLRTVHDSVLDYADPDDPEEAEDFPDGGERMLVIAQWYRETTFLDYRAGGEPGVCIADFDAPDWTAGLVRFADFDDFLAAMRRVDLDV